MRKNRNITKINTSKNKQITSITMSQIMHLIKLYKLKIKKMQTKIVA